MLVWLQHNDQKLAACRQSCTQTQDIQLGLEKPVPVCYIPTEQLFQICETVSMLKTAI